MDHWTYFCENDDGNPVTVNGNRNWDTLQIFFSKDVDRVHVNETAFQQDVTTCFI